MLRELFSLSSAGQDKPQRLSLTHAVNITVLMTTNRDPQLSGGDHQKRFTLTERKLMRDKHHLVFNKRTTKKSNSIALKLQLIKPCLFVEDRRSCVTKKSLFQIQNTYFFTSCVSHLNSNILLQPQRHIPLFTCR